MKRSAAGAGLIVGGVLAVIIIAAGSLVTYLDIAQPPSQSQSSASSQSTTGAGSGYDIGGSISGAFSMLHDAIVKTQTVTSTTTQQITSEKTILSTVVSSTTQFSTLTLTSVSTTASTTSVYAVPTNVTLLFTNINGNFTYDIRAGSSSTGGGMIGNSPYSLHLNGLFQGQTITITAATTGPGGCSIGEQFTVQLWVNGQIVAQSDTFCGDGTNGARITYTV